VCSETCGRTGVQTRTAECVDGSDTSVDADLCGDEVVVTSVTCSEISDDCATYTIGTWGDCSATCGAGVQTRTATCDADECVGSQPETSKECADLLPCPVYTWHTSSYTDCSVTCAAGIITRVVECHADGSAVESSNCVTSLGSPPISSDGCVGAGGDVCPNHFKWQLGDWSSCDSSCGAGNKTRTVACINEVTGDEADASHCLDVNPAGTATAPVSIECCFSADCVAWRVGSWSVCSSSVQTRTVRCIGTEDGTEYETAACVEAGAGAVPSALESC